MPPRRDGQPRVIPSMVLVSNTCSWVTVVLSFASERLLWQDKRDVAELLWPMSGSCLGS